MIMIKNRKIKFRVNGETREIHVRPNELLLNVIRKDLNLTGTKYGCGAGECGACTVLIDGKPKLSCLTLAIAVDGREITTIEGVGKGGLDPIQEAFIEQGAIQCGYCIPGMILSAKALLDENLNPTEEEVRRTIDGNLCRCTGYVKQVRAILSAAEKMRKEKVEV